MIVLTTTLQVERHSPLGLTVTVMVVMHVVKLYTFSEHITHNIIFLLC